MTHVSFLDAMKKVMGYTEKYGHIYRLWFGKFLVVGLSKVEDLEVFNSNYLKHNIPL